RNVPRRHALELQPENVERLRPLDGFLDAREYAHTEFLDRPRKQCARTAYRHLGAKLLEAPDVRARHPRMQHVTHDAHPAAREIAQVVAQREQVEEALRGVLVRAVARIDDVALDAIGEELRGTRRPVADHDHVNPHRLEIARGVYQRFALLHAGPGRRDVHGIGGQALLGELEGDTRASRRFEEEIDDGLAAERGHFLDGALADFLERFGGVENETDLPGSERLEREQVLAEGFAHASFLERTTTTASLPSSSRTITSTRSPFATVRVLPTMSARMGSSRPPRSTSTASAMRAGRPKSASSSSAARMVRPVEHVIHDHQVLAVDVPRNVGGANDGAWPDRLQIVAIERDVERTARNVLTLAFLHDGDEPVRKLDAAALD